jgi:hypothetical protein
MNSALATAEAWDGKGIMLKVFNLYMTHPHCVSNQHVFCNNTVIHNLQLIRLLVFKPLSVIITSRAINKNVTAN